MNAFMFPGQGSQKRGMGEGLFDAVPEFKAIEPEIDALLGYSLRELCLEDPMGRLKETAYTQPCLYIVNALHYYKAVAEGAAAGVFVGHSLGEYNALLAAGVFDLLTGLKLVKRRGELMGEAQAGSMMAVTGLDPTGILAVLREQGLLGIDVANLNAPQQTVISGPAEELQRAAAPLEKAGAQMCIPLQVSAAFHSRYMAPAARAFAEHLASVEFAPTRIPVISNVTARPYPTGTPTATARALLVKQIEQPVRWVQTVQYLRNAGVTQFQELGPGNVLTRLVEKIPALTNSAPALV